MRSRRLFCRAFALILCVCIGIFALASCDLFAKKATVSFDTAGGNEIAAVEVKVGELITSPEAPVKEGYEFLGWTLEDGTEWSFEESTVSEDVTLFAKWQCIHTYDHACDADCNREGCDFIRETKHQFSHACDTSCNTIGCGYTRVTKHVYSHACDNSCNTAGCGFTRDIQHKFDHACDTDCNVEDCAGTSLLITNILFIFLLHLSQSVLL